MGRYTGGILTNLTSITVEKGKRYRFRIVSISCDPNYTFTIDGHNFTVIEVDGISTDPLVVDSIQIFAGQRYSIVLEANQTVDNYWIRAQPNIGNRTTFNDDLNAAVLRYVGANTTTDPTFNHTQSIIPLVESNIVPLDHAPAPGQPEVGGADILLNLNIGLNASGEFSINGVPFIPPSVPVLLQILNGSQSATDLLPSGSVYVLPPNKVVELSIPAFAAGGPVSCRAYLVRRRSLSF